MIVLYLLIFVAIAILVNIPFGSYRNKTRKFSVAWFLSIHLPIPFLFVLRKLVFDLPLWTIAVSLFAAIVGQILGSRLALFGKPLEIAAPTAEIPQAE